MCSGWQQQQQSHSHIAISATSPALFELQRIYHSTIKRFCIYCILTLHWQWQLQSLSALIVCGCVCVCTWNQNCSTNMVKTFWLLQAAYLLQVQFIYLFIYSCQPHDYGCESKCQPQMQTYVHLYIYINICACFIEWKSVLMRRQYVGHYCRI